MVRFVYRKIKKQSAYRRTHLLEVGERRKEKIVNSSIGLRRLIYSSEERTGGVSKRRREKKRGDGSPHTTHLTVPTVHTVHVDPLKHMGIYRWRDRDADEMVSSRMISSEQKNQGNEI